MAPEPHRLDWIHAAGILDLIQRLLDIDLEPDLGGSPDPSSPEAASGSKPFNGSGAPAKLEHQGLKYQV